MPDRAYFDSPLGVLELVAAPNGIQQIRFPADDSQRAGQGHDVSNPHLSLLIDELRQYFAGKLTVFSCALAPEGTDFQKSVWRQLSQIPFGVTKTYGEIASDIGQPKASRAVGSANNRNPIPIVVPCHRVIGKGNALVGYGGELWRKQWLLEHEGIALPISPRSHSSE